jgi:hypothetical protein
MVHSGVYAAMVNSRVAIEVEEEVILRLDETVTSSEEENAEGRTKYLLTHP